MTIWKNASIITLMCIMHTIISCMKRQRRRKRTTASSREKASWLKVLLSSGVVLCSRRSRIFEKEYCLYRKANLV